MLVFTSITANYIPKARVLARSVKRHCPEAKFVVVLCDNLSESLGDSLDLFDAVLKISDLELPVPNLSAWLFSHSVVELCTAVKGAAFLKLFDLFGEEKVLYLDPDVVVLDELTPLELLLDRHSLLVTPHLTEPYEALEPLLDQEAGLLQHGIFNFGFLGLRNNREGRRFATWWNERLVRFCFVDLPRGLFTDQRWGDVIPVFFPDHHIIREKTYNVATWNLLQRKVESRGEGKLFIEGQPIRFFHFSGLDSGKFERALTRYGADCKGVSELHRWYLAELDAEGQSIFGGLPFHFGYYDNGLPVTREQRTFYRQRPSLSLFFANPFRTHPTSESYFHWYQKKEDRERLCATQIDRPASPRLYQDLHSIFEHSRPQEGQIAVRPTLLP